MIGRPTVGLDQHLHVDRAPLEDDRTAQEIVDGNRAFAGHLHPHDRWNTGRVVRGNLLLAEIQAMAVVARWFPHLPLFQANRVEPLGSTEAPERVTAGE